MKKTLYVFVWACSVLLALPAAAQVPGYVPTDGLVGWWPFNGNANDESGNGNDGVVNGATLTEDRFGNMESAYAFDGVNDFISVADSPILSINGDFTISAWKLEDSLSTNYYHSIVTKRLVGNWSYNLAISKIFGGTNQEMDKLITGRRNNNGAQTEYRWSDETALEGVWQHVSVTVSNNVIKFYINGIDVGYVASAGNLFSIPMQNQAVGVTIGDCNCNNNEEMQGSLDDIAIYNRALSQEEITALYTGEPVSPPAACTPLPTNLQEGLVGYWPFCGNANDESGNGHDGTVNGATLTEDRFGNANSAYSFDGFNNEIRISHHPDLNLIGDFTISSWYSTDFFPSTHNSHTIIAKRDDNLSCCSANIPYNLSVNYQQNATDFRKPIAVFAKNGSVSYYQAPYQVYLNTWTNIVLRVKTDTCSIYINGVLFLQEPLQNSQRNPNTSDLLIGSVNRAFGDEYMNGSLDDIAIYNRALSQEEITALYTGEPVSPPAACTPLPSNLQEGLVGYWPFCGNANDESGNGNDGTVNGATLTEDRFGNAGSAYGFDGVDDLIELGNFNVVGNEISINAWINESEIAALRNVILTKYDGVSFTGDNSISRSWSIIRHDATYQNKYHFQISENGQDVQESFCDSVGIANSWRMLTITRNNELVNWYIDGSFVNSSISAQIGSIFSSPTPVFIGCFAQGTLPEEATGFFNGALDDIAIYNRALTPQEVQQLYTLDACTFTVYDTLITYETIYDTLVTYETLYDTLYTYETVYDTLTTYETVLDTVTTYETFYDTLTTYETVFDTLVTYETLYDTLTTYETLYDTITTVEMLYDTVITYETLYDTLTTYETIVDTLYEYETITAYDTVTTFVTVTDTLLIDITFTGIEGQPSWLNTVTVFPNPASDHITIDYGNFALLAGYNTIITDAAGATVYSSTVNSQQAYIDINAWGAAGVYYMTIYDASGAPVAVRHIVLE